MPRQFGRFDKWVTLSRCPQSSPDNDGFYEDLDPAGTWASIQPLSPTSDGRTIQSQVRIRFHDQVNMDTRIVYDDGSRTRYPFVKSFQDVDTNGDLLVLLCEESIP